MDKNVEFRLTIGPGSYIRYSGETKSNAKYSITQFGTPDEEEIIKSILRNNNTLRNSKGLIHDFNDNNLPISDIIYEGVTTHAYSKEFDANTGERLYSLDIVFKIKGSVKLLDDNEFKQLSDMLFKICTVVIAPDFLKSPIKDSYKFNSPERVYYDPANDDSIVDIY